MTENLNLTSLYAMHPKILAPQGNEVPIGCDPGWYSLLDELCSQLQHYTDEDNAPQVAAQQIKTKFGGLRFYIGNAHPIQHALIRFTESLSYRTCAICGGLGQLCEDNGVFSTRCIAHAPAGSTPATPEEASIRIVAWVPLNEVQKGEK